MTLQELQDFLLGGFITSLSNLFENSVQWLIRFFSNIINIFLFPLVSKINELIPNVDDLSSKLQYVFDYSSPYINFFLDILFITTPVLTYLILSLIFRVLIKNNSYIVKVITKWWDSLSI